MVKLIINLEVKLIIINLEVKLIISLELTINLEMIIKWISNISINRNETDSIYNKYKDVDLNKYD